MHLGLGILAAGLFCFTAGDAAAQGARRVLILASQDSDPFSLAIEGFKAALGTEPWNVSYDVRYLGGENGTATPDVRGEAFDLCLALGSRAADAVAAEKIEAPVVAGLILRERDVPREAGIKALVTLEFPVDDQLRLLQKMLPPARVVGVLYNPEENGDFVAKAEAAAGRLGLEILPVTVHHPRDLPKALGVISRKADVLWGIPDSTVMNPETAREIILFSFRNRIPLVGISPSWVKAGALFAPSWEYRDIGRQCAELASGLLRGRLLETSGSTGPDKMRFVVNAKAAERLKIVLDPSVTKDAMEMY